MHFNEQCQATKKNEGHINGQVQTLDQNWRGTSLSLPSHFTLIATLISLYCHSPYHSLIALPFLIASTFLTSFLCITYSHNLFALSLNSWGYQLKIMLKIILSLKKQNTNSYRSKCFYPMHQKKIYILVQMCNQRPTRIDLEPQLYNIYLPSLFIFFWQFFCPNPLTYNHPIPFQNKKMPDIKYMQNVHRWLFFGCSLQRA